jgi:hypothetical protein
VSIGRRSSPTAAACRGERGGGREWQEGERHWICPSERPRGATRDGVDTYVKGPLANLRRPEAGAGDVSGVASGRTTQRVEWVHCPRVSSTSVSVARGFAREKSISTHTTVYDASEGRSVPIEPPHIARSELDDARFDRNGDNAGQTRSIVRSIYTVVSLISRRVAAVADKSRAQYAAPSPVNAFLPLATTTTTTNAPTNLSILPHVDYTTSPSPPAPPLPPLPSPSRQLDVIRKTTD